MNGKLAILTVVLVCSSVPSAGGLLSAVDADELARCGALDAPDDRLACYDDLVASVRAHGALTQPPIAANQSPAAQPSGATTQSPATATESRAAVTDRAGYSPPLPTGADSFGLARPLPVAPVGPEKIEALVDKVTEDRLGNVSLVLDNGQAWNFLESGVSLRPGEMVTIKRAALGSFLLTTRARRSYRVRRVQ